MPPRPRGARHPRSQRGGCRRRCVRDGPRAGRGRRPCRRSPSASLRRAERNLEPEPVALACRRRHELLRRAGERLVVRDRDTPARMPMRCACAAVPPSPSACASAATSIAACATTFAARLPAPSGPSASPLTSRSAAPCSSSVLIGFPRGRLYGKAARPDRRTGAASDCWRGRRVASVVELTGG